MAALSTVQDYVDRIRVLLQDTVVPYRYPDEDIVSSLNEGLQQARMKRPDLFLDDLRSDVPEYDAGSLGDTLVMDQQYRLPLVYYATGMIQLRDEEGAQDARAGAFIDKFTQTLLGVTG